MTVSTNGAAPLVVRPLGTAERAGIGAVAVLLAGLAALGAVVSFASVEAAMRPSFGSLAWAVPVGVDVGILVFTALDLVMHRLGMRTRGLHLVPWALVGVTIYLNVASESTLIGQVAHGVLPGLWVVAIEGGVRPVLRTWAGLGHGSGPVRVDRVRFSRWLLAPWPTLRLWRRMRLREVHTLPEAQALHLIPAAGDQLVLDLARAELVDRYGPVWWRWKATRRERVLYRHGALDPTHVAGLDGSAVRLGSGGVASGGGLAHSQATPPGLPRTRNTAGPTRGAGGGSRVGRNGSRLVPEVPERLLVLGRRIAGELAAEGVALTRDELVRRIRAAGESCSNARASALLARLQDEPPAGPAVVVA